MQMQSLLIADGSEVLTTQLAEALRGSYHIRVCHNGLAALEQLRERKPDVMILDLLLPELDGIITSGFRSLSCSRAAKPLWQTRIW